MVITDPVLSTVNILSDNWDSSNTADNTPPIEAIYDVKRIGGLTANKDHVGVYEIATTNITNSFGTGSREIRATVSIDIRTTVSRVRLNLLLTEVDRIIGENMINPDSDWNLIDPDDGGWQDFSNKKFKLYRKVYDIELIKCSETRG